MAAQEILALAQQGHPQAIATLINFILQPHGIKVRTQRQDHCLHVLVESTPIPKQRQTVSFIHNSLKELNVAHITTVTIYGRQQGQRSPAWRQTVGLEPPLNLPAQAPSHLGEIPAVNEPMDDRSPEQDSAPDITRANASDANTPNETDNIPAGLLRPFTSDQSPSLMVGSAEIPEILKRPEAVIFLILVTVIIFWDTYTSLLEDTPLLEDGNTTLRARLSTSQLARRLQVSRSTIRRRKRLEDFHEWTQSLDPDGVAWMYHRGTYFPLTKEV